jgi:hypothetical protein
MEWDPALVSVMPVMSKVDDGWRLLENAVVEVSVLTARVYRYLVWGKRRTRMWIKD